MVVSKLKKEKGSITLFVLIAVIFFLAIAFTAYASSASKNQVQDVEFTKIKANYENSYTNEEVQKMYTEATKENIIATGKGSGTNVYIAKNLDVSNYSKIKIEYTTVMSTSGSVVVFFDGSNTGTVYSSLSSGTNTGNITIKVSSNSTISILFASGNSENSVTYKIVETE